MSLSQFIEIAIKLDNLSRDRMSRTAESASFPHESATAEVPMQVNHARLSRAERERRRQHRLCFYCGTQGHTLQTHTKLPQRAQVSGPTRPSETMLVCKELYQIYKTMNIPVLQLSKLFPLTALINSGAEGNFMDKRTAQELEIPLIKINNPPNIRAVDGHVVG